MPDYPDLSTMYDHGLNGTATMYGAQRQQLSAQQQQAMTAYQNQQTQDLQTMSPLNAQFRQGQINSQAAELPGQVGQSQVQSAAGQMAAATAPQAMASKLMEFQTQLGDKGFEQIQTKASKMAYAVNVVKSSNVPPMNQAAALSKVLQASGIDPNDQMVAPFLQNDPSNALKNMDAASQGFALASQQYKAQSAIKAQEEAAAKDVATAHNASQERIAQTAADSRVTVAERRGQIASAHANLEQRISSILADPNWKSNPQKVQQYNDMMRSAQPLRNSAANGYQQADLLGTPTPEQRFDPTSVSGSQGASPSVQPNRKVAGTHNGQTVYEHPDGTLYTLKD